MGVYVDRLSLLPDEVLFIIISLLPFKEAVRTAILSKRWRFIPHGTRNLEFRESDFVRKFFGNGMEEYKRRAFVPFVLRWINGSFTDNSGANKFLLRFSHPEDHLFQIQQCIRFAIDREVEVLDLDFSDPTWKEDDIENHPQQQTLLQLPLIRNGELKTLQSLRLFSCNIVPANSPTSHKFSVLRCLSMGWVTLNDSRMRDLLNKCPSLETLSMRRCCYNGYIEILSKSLKSLIMEKCCPSSEAESSMLDFRVDAPELKLFKYSGVMASFSFESLNLDMEASLDFGLQKEYDMYGDYLYQLLNEIGGVKTLTVCTYMLQVICTGEEPFSLLPPLERLRHLILKVSLINRDEFYGISFFLNSCPNLEILTLDLNTPRRTFPEYEPPLGIRQNAFVMRSEYAIVYDCVKTKLKKIVVEGFKGTKNELAVLEYLLKYGRFLEEVHIKISKEPTRMGLSMEATYVKRVQNLLKLNIANQDLRILLSRRA